MKIQNINLALLSGLLEQSFDMIKSFLVFLIIFLLGYFVAQGARKITRNYILVRLPQKEIATFFSDLLFYIIIIVVVTIGLSTVGINVNALIAGLGLGGFALGFALRDIIGNFVSGLLILMTKTVEIGDYIKIMNFEGPVKSINLRHTVLLRSLDNGSFERILVPNNSIFASIMTVRRKEDKITTIETPEKQ